MKNRKMNTVPNRFLAIGLGLGIAIGVAMNNIALGTGIALIIGSIPSVINVLH